MSQADDLLKEFRASKQGSAESLLNEFRANKTLDPSEGLNPLEAGLISTGAGFVKAGRGLKGLFGLITGDEDIKREVREEAKLQRQIMGPLKERFPVSSFVGEALGETAATLPAGLGAAGLGSRLASGAAQRFAAAGAGGLAEGAIIGAAEDRAGQGAALGASLGVGLEAALPKLGKLFRRVFKRPITEADVSTAASIDNLTEQLSSAGFKPDEIADALDDISRLGPIPEAQTATQVARKAAFEREGVPIAARSRITQQPDDFARELQLTRQRDSDAANQLRQRMFDEDQALEQRARGLAREMGEDEEVGVTIQTAINNLRSEFGTKKRAAYQDLSDLVARSPDVINTVPMPEGEIKDAAIRAQDILTGNPAEQEALDKLLAQYGLIGDNVVTGPRFTTVQFLDDAGKVADTVRYRGEPQTLSIGNFENFRKRINNIFDVTDPRQSAARKEILATYDNVADEIVDNLPKGSLPSDIIEAAKNARRIARAEKVTFDPKRVIDRISKSARDGNPLMDASKVYDEVRRTSNESFNQLLSGLRSGVKGGEDAVANMKAAALIDFVEQATKSARKITSDQGASRNIFSGTNFTKAINRFGRGKAQRLFGNDWQTIKRLELIGESRITPDSAVQKGSAPDLINQMINGLTRLSERVPVVGTKVADVAGEEAAKRELRAVTKLSIKPTKDQIDDYISFSAKRTAEILGIVPSVVSELTEEN